jgi:hypothetical protein
MGQRCNVRVQLKEVVKPGLVPGIHVFIVET